MLLKKTNMVTIVLSVVHMVNGGAYIEDFRVALNFLKRLYRWIYKIPRLFI